MGSSLAALFDSGRAYFFGTSEAAQATFTNNGGTGNAAQGGYTSFLESSDAGSSTLIENGGSEGGDGDRFRPPQHSPLSQSCSTANAFVMGLTETPYFNMPN